ncbi:unnamed protein product [Moneuplotes crassus]|uniref:RING finger protein 141 n=1 Tax=Euplotes crassus TaxID=5936 RepID=A0AAD1XBX8_EUPCR|nr:unnamed protein product [Moneuplotes crassus]
MGNQTSDKMKARVRGQQDVVEDVRKVNENVLPSSGLTITATCNLTDKAQMFFWRLKNKVTINLTLNFEKPKEEAKGIPALNLGLDSEDFTIVKSLSLVQFYEIAEELIIALKYFKLRQKESEMIQRLTDLEEFNQEIDKHCVICLENPNDIVLACTHAYCDKCIKEWRMYHRSCPLCRHSIYQGSPGSPDERLADHNKYEIINIEEELEAEAQNDKIMQEKLAKCIDYLRNEIS